MSIYQYFQGNLKQLDYMQSFTTIKMFSVTISSSNNWNIQSDFTVFRRNCLSRLYLTYLIANPLGSLTKLSEKTNNIQIAYKISLHLTVHKQSNCR